MDNRFQQICGFLVLLVIWFGSTACRKSGSSTDPAQAQVELYLVDTSREGLSDEDMDWYVDDVVTMANRLYHHAEFAEFLMASPAWTIKDKGQTQGYLLMNTKVQALGDTARDSVRIRVLASGETETLAVTNALAAFLVRQMEQSRAWRLANDRAVLAEQQSRLVESERNALLALYKSAKELNYDAKDILEPDEVESHPDVLSYRVELETLKELKVQLKLGEVRGEGVEDIQRAVKDQEAVLEEAVKKLGEADVRSALSASARREVEFLLDLDRGTLRYYKIEYEIYAEVYRRLQILAELMPVEDIAISPMLVQRHGAELIE